MKIILLNSPGELHGGWLLQRDVKYVLPSSAQAFQIVQALQKCTLVFHWAKKSHRPKQTLRNSWRIKLMLIGFLLTVNEFFTMNFNHRDSELVSELVRTFYSLVLGCLRRRVLRVLLGIAKTGMPHHDSAPSRTSLTTRVFWAAKDIGTSPHPPYSLTWQLWLLFCFPKSKLTWTDILKLLKMSS